MTRVKICGITRAEDRARLGRGARARLGGRVHLLAGQPAVRRAARARGDRAGAAAVRDAGRRVRGPAARTRSRRSPRRCGSARCSCTATSAGARAQPVAPVIKAVPLDAGGRGARLDDWPRHARAARCARSGAARRHGPADRLGRGRGAIARQRPIVLAGGLTPDERGDAVAQVRPAGDRRVVGRRVGARHQGPRADARAVRVGARQQWRLCRDAGRTRTCGRSSASRDPDARGYFGAFGGRFVPETLVAPIAALEREYFRVREDRGVPAGARRGCCSTTSGGRRRSTRPRASRARGGGARIFLKREDLTHTGAHKINNALGQALLARAHGQAPRRRRDRRGPARRRHRHGVRAARPRVRRLHGRRGHGAPGAQRAPHAAARRRPCAASTPAAARSRTPSTRRCATGSPTSHDTYYLLGSALGPHPYPLMVREFQSVIGREARAQILDAGRPAADARRRLRRRRQQRHRHLRRVRRRSRRAADRRRGRRRAASRRAATPRASPAAARASCRARAPTCCRTTHGNIEPTHSISAGLDYAAVGPEHAWLRDHGRTEYTSDRRSRRSPRFKELARLEGILPALESAHAVAYASGCSADLGADDVVLVNLSGRGDKDLQSVARALGAQPMTLTGTPSRTVAHRDTFAGCKASGRTGLVTYVTAGDPDLRAPREILLRARRAPAPTCSRSACRSPIRSPTAP